MASIFSQRRKAAKKARKATGSQKAQYELEAIEPRILLAANPANLGDATAQQKVVDLFAEVDAVGTALNADAKATEKAPLVGLSANELFPGLDFGDFLKGFQTAASTYFAGAATDTTDGLVAALNQRAKDILQVTTGSFVSGASSTTNMLKLDFDFSSLSRSQDVLLDLGNSAEDLSLKLQNGTKVTVNSQANVKFSITADLTGTLSDESKYDFTRTEYSVTGDVSVAAAANKDFGIQIGVLGGKGMSTLDATGAYADDATINFDLTLNSTFTADNKLTLTELNGFGSTITSAFTTVAPLSATTNFVRVELPIKVDGTGVGGLAGATAGLGVAGNIKFYDDNVLDGVDPLIRPQGTGPGEFSVGLDTFRNFGRVTANDLLGLVSDFNTWANLFQNSSTFGANIPFLSASLGSAYDFGTLFTTMLQSKIEVTENVLTAPLVPTNLNGVHTFSVAVNATNTVVTIGAGSNRTLDTLITQLNTALPALVRARVTAGDNPRIELYSAEANPFLVTGMGEVADTLGLGFSSFNNVIGQLPNAVTASTLPTLKISSSSAITTFNFSTATTFQIARNGGSLATVTLGAGDYVNVLGLQLALRDALLGAGVLTAANSVAGTPEQGVTVGLNANGGLDLIALADTRSIQVANGSGGNLGRFNFSASTVTAPSFSIAVNGGAATTVYINPNLTDGTIGSPNRSLAAGGLADIIADVHDALVRYGVLDVSANTGIDVRDSGNGKLEFYALNPGSGTGKIQSFAITGASVAALGLPSGTANGVQMLLSQAATRPKFGTIQELAALLKDPNSDGNFADSLLNGTATPQYVAVNNEVTFPIKFSLALDPLTGVPVSLGTTAGDLTNISTTSTVAVNSTVSAEFEFGFKMTAPTLVAVDLEVSAANDYVSPEGHADGNVGDPLLALSWNGELTNDAVFRITLDDAVERTVTVTAASTVGNLSMQDLIDDINAAIRGVAGLLNGAASLANQKVYATLITTTSAALSDRIAFRTNHLKTNTSSLSVKVDAEFVASVNNAAQTLLGFAASTAGTGSPKQVTGSTNAPVVLTSDALFTITAQNGAPAAVRVYAEDTTDNVLLSDLIDDINQAIRRQVTLMSGGTELEHQVVQASASGSNIRLQINELASSSNSLQVQTTATYQASNSNGAVTELGFAASGFANADISELTVTAETDAILNLPTAASFRVSLDGGAGQIVTLAAANYASLAALLTAVNSALGTAGLGTKMRAAAFGETGQVRLIVTDATVNSIRVDADAANAAVTKLGLNPDGIFARARGGTYFVDNVTLQGVATVSSNPVDVDANLGPVAFKSGAGSTLDLRAAGKVLLQDSTNRTRFTINELGNKLVNDQLADVTVISGGGGATGLITIFNGPNATYATLDLKGLTMAEVGDNNPNTTSITGLSFGLNPEIKLELKTADAVGTIQSINLNNLNTYAPTYTDLNNVDKLARLTFADVVQGLYGTAEFISDFMAHDRPGVTATVFGQKLPFIDFSLLELVDFGALFKAAVDSVAASQPRSLQEFETALESALGVSDTGVSLAVVQSAGAISLQVLVDWEATFNKKLPLYVDLSILGRAWGNEPLVSQDLAMSVIATGENNLLVDLAARARLHLDLGVKLYDGTNRIYPTPVMRDATRMDVDVNLSGTNMNFNVPVGPSTVQIRNGAVVINANGAIPGVDGNGVQSILDPAAFNEALAPDTTLNARVATTANLAATYDNVGAGVGATLTGSAAGSLNELLNGVVSGIDGVTSLAVNDLVLVMRQTNGAQNGLYQITALGSTALTQTFVLTRVATADEVTEVGQLRIRVAEGGAYGKQLFKQNSAVNVMGTSGQDYIRLIEPMRMSIDVAGDRILPWAVRVATTAALVATYNSNVATLNLRPTLTANGNGDLNDTGIDGIKTLEVGELVLVKNQTEAGYNGIYRIKSLGSATTAWVLERTEFADSATEVTDLRAAVQEGSLNGGKRFKQTLVPTAIGAGFSMNFSSTLSDVVTTLNNTVNELWAATPVNGQGQALLPLSVVTFNAQGQSDFTTLGPLSITINNDTNYVPEVSGFSGMQRYLDMATSGPVVNQAGNFFTVRFATPLPQVSDFIPKTDVRLLLRDPVLLADSLDLSLFNLQFAMDTATGQRLPLVGTLMTDFTQYIEGFRVALTTALRNNLRGDILNPLTVARDSIWNVLGTDGGGLRYLVEKDGVGLLNKQDVIVKLLDINGNDIGWDINAADIVRDPDQDGIDDLPTNAYSIEFGLHLRKQLAAGNLDQIDLAVPATGFDLSPKTDNQGVNLQTFFDFDFTFGLSLSEGFYLKENPDNNAATPDIKLTFAAALDGDLAAAGVQDFTQAGFGRTSPDYSLYTSTMFDLAVVAKDLKGSPIAFDLGDGAGAIHGGKSGFYGTFTFDLTDGRSGSALQDKHLSVDEQYGKRPTQLVVKALNADNDIQLQLATHHPNAADIGLDWHYNWRFGTGVRNAGNVDPFAGIAYTSTVNGKTVTNPSSLLAAPDGTLRGTLPAVTFVDIKVDLSTIFGGVLKPAIDYIQDAIDPFRPFIDFMKTEIPGLSTILGRPVTVLDLAAATGVVNPAFLAAIKALDVIQGLVNSSVAELNAAKSNGSSGPGIFGKGSNGGAVGLGNFNIAGVGLMLAKGADADQKKNNFTNRNAGGNTWENYKKDAQATKATSRDKAFVASRDVKPNLDSGGGIVFGFLDPNEIIKLLNGQPADLFLLDLPKFSLAVSLERSFPLPPFPAISAKIRVTISAFFNLGFGWDTEGFYLSDVHNPGKIPTTDRSKFTDTPEFGLSFRITVGGALNLAVIEAGIEAYFQVSGTVDWNDPNNDGKIRESERVILRTLPGGRLNEIDINVKGEFGITIYADVFALFDWVRVFEYGFGPWVVFNKDFLGNDPSTVPATLVGDTLYINIGPRAAQRVYPNVSDIGETVKIENAGGSAAAGETVKVTMSFLPGSPNVTYSGVKKVIAVGGAGDDTIDARSLLYAVVDFDGGDGNDVLIAGAAATLVTATNRNILRGGAGNDKIYGSQKWDSLFGGAGNDELIAYGTPNDPGATTTDEADTLEGGAGTDTLDGGRGADAYVFQDGWGRDRIVEQNDTAANTMNFSAVTTALDMNLGRILYSVSSGSNYAFADPGLFSRVDGGSAADRINVTNFFASMGLTIDGRQGADFYAVTLGDSTSTLAAGTLTLTDTGTSGKDTFLLLPTRADEIEATINRVLNGRETVNTTGLEDFIIDAGSFTVRLGQSGVDWVNLGERSVVTAGVIKMLSSLEANSFDWALTNGMSVDKSINARNNGNIRIELTNPDPNTITNFTIGANSTTFQPRITSSPGSIFNLSTPTLSIPGISGVSVPGVFDVQYDVIRDIFNIPYLTTSGSAVTVAGTSSVTVASQTYPAGTQGITGIPGFTIPGRAAYTIPGRAAQVINGVTIPAIPAYTVPAIAAYTHTSTVTSNIAAPGTAQIIVPATADFVIPAVAATSYVIKGVTYTDPGRAAITIPGRPQFIIPATPPLLDLTKQDGNGTGTIKLANFNGSLLNATGTPGALPGLIEAANGKVLLQARYNIGQPRPITGETPTDRIQVRTGTLAVATRDTIAGGSIYIGSSADLKLSTIEGIAGAVTAKGDVDIKLAAGKKLTVDKMSAGGAGGAAGGNIYLTADEIDLTSKAYVTTPVIAYRTLTFSFFGVSFPYRIPYIQSWTTTFTTVTPVSGANITLQSTTNALPIAVAGAAGSNVANQLDLNVDDLAALRDGFQSIIIGGETTAGVVTVSGYAFKDPVVIRGSKITVLANSGALTVDGTLTMTTINNGADGNISILAGTPAVSAKGIVLRATGDVTLSRALTVGTTPNSVIEISAGTDGTGGVTINQTITATGTGSSLLVNSGTAAAGGSGNIIISAVLDIADLIDLNAEDGSITNSVRLKTKLLKARAFSTLSLLTDVNEVYAEVLGTGTMTLNELNSITLIKLINNNGDIIVNAGGNITTGQLPTPPDLVHPLAPTDIWSKDGTAIGTKNVTLNAGGFIDRAAGRIIANLLTADASGPMTLETQVNTLNASTLAAGAIIVHEIDDITLTDVDSFNGAITIDADGSILAKDVASLTDSDANDITLRTKAGGAGTITADRIYAGTLGDVFLTSDGAILDDATGTAKITAHELSALAEGAITLDTDVARLAARARVAGNILVTEANDIVLTALPGFTEALNAFDGTITVNAQGSIDVAADVQARTTQDVFLTAGLGGAGAITRSGGFVIGDTLTARAAGAITLFTNLNTLDAATSAVGDIFVTEVDGILLDSILSYDGLINVTVGSIGTGGNTGINTITAGTNLIATNLTPSNIVLDGFGDITVNVGGKITGNLLTADARGQMTLLTSINTLNASTLGGVGSITVTEDNGIELFDVDSFNGAITVTALAGDILATDVQSLTDDEINDIRITADTGNISANLVSAGLTAGDLFMTSTLGWIEETNPEDAGADLIADHAELKARGSIGGVRPLETTFNTLIAQSNLQGDIAINETDAIVLENVFTSDGSITFHSGGTITAFDVQSLNSALDRNDILLHATAGDILLDLVSAGTNQADVILTADAGNIEEVNPEDAGVDLEADNALLNAFGSIGGLHPIETRLTTLTAHTNAAGNIDLNEFDAIELTDVDTINGSITIDAGGTITALDVQSLTDADANDIIIHTTLGDILADYVSAGASLGDLFLTADLGSIEETNPEDPGVDLQADNGVLIASANIGGARPLETDFNRITIKSTVGGNIAFNEKDGLVIDDITAANGYIRINAGGNVIAFNIQSLLDAPGNDVTLHTTLGNIYFDRIEAGSNKTDPSFGEVNLFADQGSILEFGGDGWVDLRANRANLVATGAIGPFQTQLNFLNADSTITGGIAIIEVNGLELTHLLSNNGPISVTAGGTLYVRDVATGNDVSGNTITLVTTNGDILIDRLIAGQRTFTGSNPAGGADVIITATGSILEATDDAGIDIRARGLTLRAGTGIGSSNTLEVAAVSFAVNSSSGTISLLNFSSAPVTISTLSTGSGNIFFRQTGGGSLTLFSGSVGSGSLNVTVTDRAYLYVYRSTVGGRTVFEADEIDFLGGRGSIRSTSSLTLRPNRNIPINFYSLSDNPNALDISLRDILAFQGFSDFVLLGKPNALTPIFFLDPFLNYPLFNEDTAMDDQLSAIDLEYFAMVRRVMQEVYQALSLRPAVSGFSGSENILQRYRLGTSILGVGSGDVDPNEYSILEEMPPDSGPGTPTPLGSNDDASGSQFAQSSSVAADSSTTADSEDLGDLSGAKSAQRESLLSFDSAVSALSIAGNATASGLKSVLSAVGLRL